MSYSIQASPSNTSQVSPLIGPVAATSAANSGSSATIASDTVATPGRYSICWVAATRGLRQPATRSSRAPSAPTRKRSRRLSPKPAPAFAAFAATAGLPGFAPSPGSPGVLFDGGDNGDLLPRGGGPQGRRLRPPPPPGETRPPRPRPDLAGRRAPAPPT